MSYILHPSPSLGLPLYKAQTLNHYYYYLKSTHETEKVNIHYLMIGIYESKKQRDIKTGLGLRREDWEKHPKGNRHLTCLEG